MLWYRYEYPVNAPESVAVKAGTEGRRHGSVVDTVSGMILDPRRC
jgi:hypothetical protein